MHLTFSVSLKPEKFQTIIKRVRKVLVGNGHVSPRASMTALSYL